MRKISYIMKCFCLCLLAGLLFACDAERDAEPMGFLYLNVEEDATLQTKAAVVDESLRVAILRGEGDTLQVYQDYLQEVRGERLILPVGVYTVAVSSNHDGKAHWETPFYAGSEEVTVKQGEITNAKVTCTIANTKVSVKYTDSMRDYFSDYQTTVSNSSGELTYTRDEYRSGYFAPEKLTVQLDLVNRDGNKFALKRVYPDVKPQCHYTFAFKLNTEGDGDTDAGMDMDVSIDTEHNEIIYPIYIKQEDLTNAVRPSLALNGFDESNTYVYKEGSELPSEGTIQLTYTMGKESQLQYAKVSTDSPQFMEQGLGYFDWMDEADAARAAALGFPAFRKEPTEVKDMKASYTVDLSGILRYVRCVDGKPTTHTFTVELLDDKYQEASATFSIKINPSVAAFVEQPAAVWTNFAVIKGFCADEGSYFMVKANDGEEKEVKVISLDAEGNMTALLTGLRPNVAYTYRIVSDNDPTMQCSMQTFTIFAPLAVPNLGFEEWNTITTNKLSFSMGKDYLSPNATNDFNEAYWETGNYGASAISKKLTENTTDVAVEGSTQAAKMQSQYAGLGSLGAFSAGSVFTGKPTSVGTSGAKLEYGRLHNGFPTRLSGYCKYSPGMIDYVNNSKQGGGKDQAIIYIALSTEIFRLQSLTNGSINRFDKSASSIIAYGEYVIAEEISAYEAFEIPLIYREGKLPAAGTPIYITIVATSSIDGDEFTGSTNSVLYIDELSLNYDYNAASIAGTAYGALLPNNISEE